MSEATRPDEAAFRLDVESGSFGVGELRDDWRCVEIVWPTVLLWLSAPQRPAGPDGFSIRLNCEGYPHKSPTGTFWCPAENSRLAPDKWPKGRARVKAVFRTDWEAGCAFYHPYDRYCFERHSDWPQKYSHKLWTPEKTIGDWVAEFHDLLNSDEYTGV